MWVWVCGCVDSKMGRCVDVWVFVYIYIYIVCVWRVCGGDWHTLATTSWLPDLGYLM